MDVTANMPAVGRTACMLLELGKEHELCVTREEVRGKQLNRYKAYNVPKTFLFAWLTNGEIIITQNIFYTQN